jgi:hypothetical protein
MNIPSAEKFLEHFNYRNQELGIDVNYPMIERCMIDFAKLHVQAALKAASDNLEYKLFDSSIPHVIDSSIFDSYSLENIK